MKLWQGWHNTDLGRSYFHYGPLGGTKKQMGILAQTCKKRGVKSTGEKSGKKKYQAFIFTRFAIILRGKKFHFIGTLSSTITVQSFIGLP